MQPTETQIAQCETRFFGYCGKFGYDKAVRVMSREYSSPDQQEIWRSVQTQGKIKGHAVSKHATTAHKADKVAVKATGRYSDLHRNTGG